MNCWRYGCFTNEYPPTKVFGLAHLNCKVAPGGMTVWDVLQVNKLQVKVIGTELDAIHLSIFSHRFMSIAEQMGR